MKMASKLAFIDKAKCKKKVSNNLPNNIELRHAVIDEAEDVDTNVFKLGFENIKQAEKNIQLGDPINCKKCQSTLNIYSRLFSYNEYLTLHENSKKMTIEEEMKEEEEEEVKEGEKTKILNAVSTANLLPISSIKPANKIWICEFCDEHNIITVEKEEIPTKEDVTYVLHSASQAKSNVTNDNDISVIFCIDISGSMNVTTEIQGKMDLKHGLSPEEYEMLKQFIEVGADQYLPRQKKNTTYVSRKQCVFAAIENQIKDMIKENPKRKVGLVAFNNEVAVYGDGKALPEIIAGDKLYNYNVCLKLGEDNYSKLLSNDVTKSSKDLLKKFDSIKADGKTALGPALVSSIGLASKGKPGSMVVICTDGMANVGLGELDTPNKVEKSKQFYYEVGQYAKSKGIVISIISIKGEGCKLEALSHLPDLTSGSLVRVDPANISKDFASILRDEILGTKVIARVKLHKAFRFRNEKPEDLQEDGSLCKKDIGNITSSTQLIFEYENKTDEQLVAMGLDLQALKEIPFQAQITYNSTEGHTLLRVITVKLKTTSNLEEAEKHVDLDLLGKRAIQQQAELAKEGLYAKSEEFGKKWSSYLEKNVSNNLSNANFVTSFKNFENQNKAVQKSIQKKSLKSANLAFEAKSKSIPQPPQSGLNLASMSSGGGGGGGASMPISNASGPAMKISKSGIKPSPEKKNRIVSKPTLSKTSSIGANQPKISLSLKAETFSSQALEEEEEEDDEAEEQLFKFKNNKWK